MSTYFFVNSIELLYCPYDIQWELVDKKCILCSIKYIYMDVYVFALVFLELLDPLFFAKLFN